VPDTRTNRGAHPRDGTVRDMASMSGHYRRVKQTLPALELLSSYLETHGPRRVRWYLDRPISNSGRFKKRIEEVAASRRGVTHPAEQVAS